jgi:hypothetical protein
MYYTVYKVTNLVNGKTYIGRHITENPNDNYLGSGTRITAAHRKYGIENFVKEILYIFDNREDMIRKEEELVNLEYIQEDSNYNIALGGDNGWNCKGMLLAIEKSTDNKIWVTSEEYKKNRINYKHITEDTTCVLDENAGTYKRIPKELFDSNIHITPVTGTAVVWDDKKEKYHRIPSQEYDKKVHITPTSNSIKVYDKEENAYARIDINDYHKNKSRYLTHSTDKKSVRNKLTGETSSIKVDDYNESIHESVLGGIVVNKEGINQYVSKDEYYSDDTLKVKSFGHVTAYDKVEKRTRHVPKEEYHLNKERYEANGYGSLLVVNKETKEISRIKKTEYEKNLDIYESFSKNKRTVWVKEEKRFRNIPKEDFDREKHALASDKHIRCIDKQGNIIIDFFGTKKDFCSIYGDTLYNVAIKETKNWNPPHRNKFSVYFGANFELIDWKQNER